VNSQVAAGGSLGKRRARPLDANFPAVILLEKYSEEEASKGEQSLDCDFCGAPISQGDLESGRAMILMKKTFFQKCLKKAVQKSKDCPADKKRDSSPSSTVSANS
jgi:hypothetical protein